MHASGRRASQLTVYVLLLFTCMACNGVDALQDEATAISLVAMSGSLRLAPGKQADVVVQAKNSEGSGVDGVRVFFLVGDTSVVSIAGHEDSQVIFERTARQEAAGFSGAGLAKVTLVAADKAGGESTKVVAGLSSPSDTAAADGVSSLMVIVDELDDADGGIP